jgi:hypothetical protein
MIGARARWRELNVCASELVVKGCYGSHPVKRGMGEIGSGVGDFVGTPFRTACDCLANRE